MIEFPTNLATIVGRWACDGPADLEAVRGLQRGLTLEPFGAAAPATGLPVPVAVPDELAFFEQLRTWMRAFPPSAQDQDYQQRFAPLGLLDPASPFADCPAELSQALTAGRDATKQGMETALKPVDAFWSITMYDLPDFYLVANPIGRYSIGDRTPGLRRGADGSLTIAIQHEPPADTGNWLPAPAAPFRPLMRLYQPRAAILDGTYTIPPVTKAPS